MDNIELPSTWRYASRKVRFIKFDYRLFYFFILFLFHMSYATLYLIGAAAIIMFIIEVKYKYTLEAAFRRLSCFVSGKFKSSVSARRMNRGDK